MQAKEITVDTQATGTERNLMLISQLYILVSSPTGVLAAESTQQLKFFRLLYLQL